MHGATSPLYVVDGFPIENVRFAANYAHLKFNDARIAATNGDRDYKVDSLLFRFQIFY